MNRLNPEMQFDEEQLADAVAAINDRLQQNPELTDDELLADYPSLTGPLRHLLPAARAVLQNDADIVHVLPEANVLDGSQQLGDFRLLREIGRGGMGVVYEAEQLSLGRRVALKVLTMAGLLDSQQLQRFRNEAQAAATLHHPHITPVFAVGSERGVYYYAMQLIDGASLAQLIDGLREDPSRDEPVESASFEVVVVEPLRGEPGSTTHRQLQAQLSTMREHKRRDYQRQAAVWIADAADALAFAHENGVLHRDIKPGNLLIDSAGKIWVADFGLARIEGNATMTRTGDLVGTLRYMSPEQALGNRVLVDQRSDVYSLGMTLYEIITLRQAFDAANREELLRRIADDEPASPRSLDPTIPVDLETILLKAIAKDPQERYVSAADLSADLRRFLQGAGIQARRPSLGNRTWRWINRRRASVATVVLSVFVALLAIAASQFVANRRVMQTLAKLQVAHEQLAEAKTASDESFNIAAGAMNEFYENFKWKVSASTELDDEFHWAWETQVGLARQLVNLRPDARPVRFRAIRVMAQYVHDARLLVKPKDVDGIVSQMTQLLDGVVPDELSADEAVSVCDGLYAMIVYKDEVGKESPTLGIMRRLIDRYEVLLRDPQEAPDERDPRHVHELCRMFERYLRVCPADDERKVLVSRALHAGQHLYQMDNVQARDADIYGQLLTLAYELNPVANRERLDLAVHVLDEAHGRASASERRLGISGALAHSLFLRASESRDLDEKIADLERINQLIPPLTDATTARREPIAEATTALTELYHCYLTRGNVERAVQAADRASEFLQTVVQTNPDSEEFKEHLQSQFLRRAIAQTRASDQVKIVAMLKTGDATFVAIRYTGTVRLMPGSAEFDLTAPDDGAPYADNALVKYDAHGKPAWVRAFRNLDGAETGRCGVRVDDLKWNAGGLYVAARADGHVDLDPDGPSDSRIDARSDEYGKAFVARFDADTGQLAWRHDAGSKAASGNQTYYVYHDLAVDRAGTAYFTFNSASMNPTLSANALNVTFAGKEFSNAEGFYQQAWLATITADGQVQRIQRFGSFRWLGNFGAAGGSGITVKVDDTPGNPADWRIVLATSASGCVYLGDAPTLAEETQIGEPADDLEWVARYVAAKESMVNAGLLVMSLNRAGQLVWSRFFNGAGRQSVNDMLVDEQGEIYIHGNSVFWPKSQAGAPLELAATEHHAVTDPVGGLILRMDRDGRLLSAANSARYNVVQMIGVTENGPLLAVKTRQPVVVGGLLLEPQAGIARYVLQLDRSLTIATPWYVEKATVSNSAVDSRGVTTITAADDSTGPDALKDHGDSSSVYFASLPIDTPPSLPAARTVVVFEDSFETNDDGEPWSGRWETDEQDDWFQSRQRAVLGEYSAEVDGSAKDATLTMAQPIDLTPYTAAHISFRWLIESSFDEGEYLAADIWNGSEWQEMERLEGGTRPVDSWQPVELHLPGDLRPADFRLRFRARVSGAREDANVDNLRITAIQLDDPR